MGDKIGNRRAHGSRPSRFSEYEERMERDRSPRRLPTLRVSNLPCDWKWKTLKDFFNSKVGEVAHVDVFEGNDQGIGLVKFFSNEALEKALKEVRGYIVDGRKLYIDVMPSGEMPPRLQKKGKEFPKDNIHPEDEMNNGSNEKINYYGLNKNFLNALQIKPPIPNKAFLMNLSFKVTREKLFEIFSMAGKVHHVELFDNPDGTHKGMAVIEFDHPVEVVQAISMFHKQILYDRPMIVQVDKLSEKREFSLPEGLKGVGPGLGPQGSALRNVGYTIDKQMEKNDKHPENVRDDQPFMNSNINMMAGNQTTWRASEYPIGPQNMTNQPVMNNAPMNMNTMPQSQYDQMGKTQIPMNNQMMMNQMQGSNPMPYQQTGPGDVNLGNMNAQTLMTLMNLQTQIQQQGLSVNDIPKLLSSMAGGDPKQRQGGSIDRNSEGRGYPGDRRKPTSDLIGITNLPQGITEDAIFSKMVEVGQVKFVEMTGPRSAIVKFTSIWDAEKAINCFNHTRIHGCVIELKYR